MIYNVIHNNLLKEINRFEVVLYFSDFLSCKYCYFLSMLGSDIDFSFKDTFSNNL